MTVTSPEPITFQSEGLTVTSVVLEKRSEADGTRTFVIRSSSGLRHQDNCHSFGPGVLITNDGLRAAQQWFAQQFARELRGFIGADAYPRVDISNPATSGHPIGALAIVELDSPVTFVHPVLLGVLGAQVLPAGIENGGLGDQSARVRVRFGDQEIDLDVRALPSSSQGAMCVLGKDFCNSLRQLDWRLYHRLIDDNVEKAYRFGAHARENGVLLLGSYQASNRELLSKIGNALFENGYRGVMLDEFADISDNSLEQKLLFLSAISKFVLCLDTAPAGHYVELSICARFGVVTALLTNNQDGMASSAMLYDLSVRNRFMRAFAFNPNNIDDAVRRTISWADEAGREKIQLYNEIYAKWRGKPA